MGSLSQLGVAVHSSNPDTEQVKEKGPGIHNPSQILSKPTASLDYLRTNLRQTNVFTANLCFFLTVGSWMNIHGRNISF